MLNTLAYLISIFDQYIGFLYFADIFKTYEKYLSEVS